MCHIVVVFHIVFIPFNKCHNCIIFNTKTYWGSNIIWFPTLELQKKKKKKKQDL